MTTTRGYANIGRCIHLDGRPLLDVDICRDDKTGNPAMTPHAADAFVSAIVAMLNAATAVDIHDQVTRRMVYFAGCTANACIDRPCKGHIVTKTNFRHDEIVEDAPEYYSQHKPA